MTVKKKWLPWAAVGLAVLLAATYLLAYHGETEPTLLEGGKIPTPVGTLYYPEEWVDDVSIEDISKGKRYIVRVSASVDGEKVCLFDLHIGDKGTGYQLGKAPDSSGKMQSIWLDIRQIEPGVSWPEEEIQRIELLQGMVNELIMQINDLPGFVENR